MNIKQINLNNTSYDIVDAGGRTLIAKTFNGISYDKNAKKIYFLHDGVILKDDNNQDIYIDTTDFVKDGMVDDVEVLNGNLVITFNTDSGKSTITIPISDIFDANNYYTKTQTDTLLSAKENITNKVTSNIPLSAQSTDTEYPSAKLVYESIQAASGTGEMNVIEIVKVNGVALTPDANKAVDVPTLVASYNSTNESLVLS